MNRIKIGVIGCGAIAQVQHLPNIMDLQDLFDVTTVCDISARAAEYVASRFRVPRSVTDYRDLLDGDVDAVLHCAGGYKPDAAVAALEAGKHLFIEKPMCASLEDADRIIAAQKAAGKVGQVGYMKVFDPAFVLARREVATMPDIQFVQVNHLHPNNALHLSQFDVRHFDDAPRDVLEADQGPSKRHFAVADGLVASTEISHQSAIRNRNRAASLCGLGGTVVSSNPVLCGPGWCWGLAGRKLWGVLRFTVQILFHPRKQMKL